MYTLGEAAKQADCSKATVSRAIKLGKLSARRLEDKSYQIEPAELQRWLESNGHRNSKKKQIKTPDKTGSNPNDSNLLQAELETLRQLAEDRAQTIEDLRQRLDKSEDERTKSQAQLTALLTDQRAPKGFWKRLTGR